MIHLEFALLYGAVAYLYWLVLKLSKSVAKLESQTAEELFRLKRVRHI